jgi:hypothetical protein
MNPGLILILKSLELQSGCGQVRQRLESVAVESRRDWSRKVLAVLEVMAGVMAGRWWLGRWLGRWLGGEGGVVVVLPGGR